MASTISEPTPSVPRTEGIGDSSYVRSLSTRLFILGESLSGNERNHLFLNNGDARFEDVSSTSGADSMEDGRAVIAADFDGDGDNDLFVHNSQRERHRYYENRSTPLGDSLKIRLRATKSQYEAIGAEVTLFRGAKRITQVMSRGHGFLTCSPPELVFGIERGKPASLMVRWPGGKTEHFVHKGGPATLTLIEGMGKTDRMAL